MSKYPLVSVICLCYNQSKWIEEAVRSVKEQTYSNIELILLDDASTDNSQDIIMSIAKRHPEIKVILHNENKGNCKSFNEGFRISRGHFIIDLAADDVMLSDRIASQVECFQNLGPDYGVVFTDAVYIDDEGNELHSHNASILKRRLVDHIPEGDVFKTVLSRYFISSPTMMIRRTVLEEMGGYDEMLAYEDFDFWVRSSRKYKYGFLNKILTKVRRHSTSMSKGWYVKGDKQLYSTYLVCSKAVQLCHSHEEIDSLAKRVKYELRQSVFSDNYQEGRHFFRLLTQLKKDSVLDRLLAKVISLRLPLRWLRNFYYILKYR